MRGTLMDSRRCGNDDTSRMRPPIVRFRSPGLLSVILAAPVLLLCACGQSGDLYLPDKKETTPAPAAAASPAAATPEDEEKKKKEQEEGATPPPASTLPPSNTPTTP